MRVAIVHDWLTGMRGGEKCLEVFCEIFPSATIFTLLHIKGTVSEIIENMDIRTSFVQKLPFAKKNHQKYLPLFPTAVELFDLRNYDLVLSLSHCIAKGAITLPYTTHICYCFTPMRYAWEMYNEYFGKGKTGFVSGKIIPFFINYLRMWDEISSNRVDYFVAISKNVASRINKHYRRDADVIYPPVDTEFFKPIESPLNKEGIQGEYYLIVSALVPYKRIDIAIDAFNKLGKNLIIIGSGVEKENLRKMAKSNISFLGWQSNEILREYYSNCKAFIFPGEEDFGITPLEAQACGRPVIGYGAGGVLESVRGKMVSSNQLSVSGNQLSVKQPITDYQLPITDYRLPITDYQLPITNYQNSEPPTANCQLPTNNLTGLFFYPQTSEALINAIEEFESMKFDSDLIRQNSLLFDKSLFRKRIKEYIDGKLGNNK